MTLVTLRQPSFEKGFILKENNLLPKTLYSVLKLEKNNITCFVSYTFLALTLYLHFIWCEGVVMDTVEVEIVAQNSGH